MLGGKNSYQHYKVLSSVAPLLPVGIACLGHAARLVASATCIAVGAVITRFTLGTALGLTLVSTLNLTFRAGGGLGLTQEAMGRGGQFNLVDQAMRQIQQELERRAGQTVYIAANDGNSGIFSFGDLVALDSTTLGVQHRVLLTDPSTSAACTT